MTILPPLRQAPHECDLPNEYHFIENTEDPVLPRWSLDVSRPSYKDDTLWECPDCGRWWRFHYLDACWDYYEWRPVRWYDVAARRRIAAHKEQQRSTKNGYENRTVKPIHWWDCHPNPNRGRP